MLLFALAVTLLAQAAPPPRPAALPSYARVVLETTLGPIEIEIDQANAPITAANFLKYVEAGRYDGGRFHRTVRSDNQPENRVKIEVVQAGVDPRRQSEDWAPIQIERTRDTGIKHRDGTISMARDGPDSATSDFFICIGDQPELDFGGKRNPDGQGFAAFGRVVRGMDVVRRIQGSPADHQVLTPPVVIRTARPFALTRQFAAGRTSTATGVVRSGGSSCPSEPQ